MLFKVDTLNQIEAGEVTIAFRKWKRPTVKKGGTLITRIGQLKILDIVPINIKDIKDKDLRNAGIDNIDILKRSISKIPGGQLYKISFTLIGPDPRIVLRNNDHLTSADINLLKNKLERMDKASKQGPWTSEVLQLINQYPKRRAVELAEVLSVEKDWLKPNIRKLKGLGLTISHIAGYELSPRGKALLKGLEIK